LATLQPHNIRPNPDFDGDLTKLIGILQQKYPKTRQARRYLPIVLGTALIAVLGLGFIVNSLANNGVSGEVTQATQAPNNAMTSAARQVTQDAQQRLLQTQTVEYEVELT